MVYRRRKKAWQAKEEPATAAAANRKTAHKSKPKQTRQIDSEYELAEATFASVCCDRTVSQATQTCTMCTSLIRSITLLKQTENVSIFFPLLPLTDRSIMHSYPPRFFFLCLQFRPVCVWARFFSLLFSLTLLRFFRPGLHYLRRICSCLSVWPRQLVPFIWRWIYLK